jgi:type VI protein secretion system component Hcp
MIAYVEFDKPIDDYFVATSYSVGASMGAGGLAGGGSFRAQVRGMQFTKDRDSLSPLLAQHCAAGTEFATVWVEICQDADSDVYITYTLSGVVVTSVQFSGSGESVGLDYTSSKAVYAGR